MSDIYFLSDLGVQWPKWHWFHGLDNHKHQLC